MAIDAVEVFKLSLGPIGVVIGAWIQKARDVGARKFAFKEKQLHQFYAPLFGIRQEIAQLSTYRYEIGRAALEDSYEFDSILESDEIPRSVKRAAVDEMSSRLGSQDEYSERQVRERLTPLYIKLQELFRDNIALADMDTLEYWPVLVRFNEFRRRSEETEMPISIVHRVRVWEQDVRPFYRHIGERMIQLRHEIETGRTRRTFSQGLRRTQLPQLPADLCDPDNPAPLVQKVHVGFQEDDDLENSAHTPDR